VLSAPLWFLFRQMPHVCASKHGEKTVNGYFVPSCLRGLFLSSAALLVFRQPCMLFSPRSRGARRNATRRIRVRAIGMPCEPLPKKNARRVRDPPRAIDSM